MKQKFESLPSKVIFFRMLGYSPGTFVGIIDLSTAIVGQEGMEQMDIDGSAHGSMAELLRSLQHIGPSRTYLERYEKFMQDGDSLSMVRAPEQQRKQLVADIMRKHSPHRVTYFGLLVIEEV